MFKIGVGGGQVEVDRIGFLIPADAALDLYRRRARFPAPPHLRAGALPMVPVAFSASAALDPLRAATSPGTRRRHLAWHSPPPRCQLKRTVSRGRREQVGSCEFGRRNTP
jgi:hypothetical protein